MVDGIVLHCYYQRRGLIWWPKWLRTATMQGTAPKLLAGDVDW